MTVIKKNYVGIGPKLPLAYDKKHGPYGLIADPREEIKQNLLNIILTNPGERVMDSNFGVGIKAFLFENFTSEVVSKIKERVYNQVAKYLPSVVVNNVDVGFDEVQNILNVRLVFFIPALGTVDNLNINVEDTTVSL
jgi:phage baseplate assembly protein W